MGKEERCLIENLDTFVETGWLEAVIGSYRLHDTFRQNLFKASVTI